VRHREVQVAVAQPRQHPRQHRLAELHVDRGQPRVEVLERRRQHGQRERGAHRQRNGAGGPVAYLRDLVARALHVGQQQPGAGREGPAELGEPHALDAALDQRRADLALQFAHDLGHGRLRDAQHARGAANAHLLDHRHEGMQLIGFHENQKLSLTPNYCLFMTAASL
jgi:hypothetical protein